MPCPSRAHSSRLRSGRCSVQQQVYLLTATTHERKPVLTGFACARLLIGEMRNAEQQGLVESLAWVVMPDHLHWLVALRSGSLEELMRQVKSNSARAINRQLGLSGRLWQDGYHDHALRREEDLQVVARYIVANPLRAGLAQRVGDYPWWDAVWL